MSERTFTAGIPGAGLVLTERGPVPIAEVWLGDRVLTHQGRYRPVRKIGSGTRAVLLCGLRLNGTVDVQHFVADQRVFVRRTIGRRLGDPTFIPASEVRVGDRLGFPVDQEIGGTAALFVDQCGDPRIVTKGGRASGRYAKPRHTATVGRIVKLDPLNDALWWLLGVYVGDGYRRAARHEVMFCVGPEEGELAIQVLASLAALGIRNANIDRYGGRSNVKIRVNSRHLSQLAGAFGDGAAAKNAPAMLCHLETSLLRAFLAGYLAADGCEQPRRMARTWLQARRKAASISLPLLRSLQRLFLRLGEFWCLNQCWSGGDHAIEGRRVHTRPRWEIVHRADPRKRTVAQVTDGTAWVRVRSISLAALRTRIWNLEVADDGSFCVPLIATQGSEIAA